MSKMPSKLVAYSYEGVDGAGTHLYSVCTTDVHDDGPHECVAQVYGADEDEARERAEAIVEAWNREVLWRGVTLFQNGMIRLDDAAPWLTTDDRPLEPDEGARGQALVPVLLVRAPGSPAAGRDEE